MSDSRTVRISLGERSYDILLSQGVLEVAPRILDRWMRARDLPCPAQAVVIADEHVGAHALTVADSLRGAGWRIHQATVASGETSKSLEAAARLYDELVSFKTDRRTSIIAVGGGVVGDLAGFVAATFNRGLPFIQIPTTLLADVDSSVGGKVGINHPAAKNLIGAFHQPLGVIIDIDCLKTLPRREFRSGLAEVVKYGVILDERLFEWLESNAEKLLELEPEALRQAIARSCELKASVVEKDEFERTGARAALNYGHTFAHAFEALAGYGELLHGEAVAIGMVCASRLAERLGRISGSITSRQVDVLRRCELPTEVPASLRARGSELIECMRLDKKSVAGQLRFVLPTKLGDVETVGGVSEADVLAVLNS